MKISTIRLWHVPLKSHEAYHMADGKTCDTVETVILALDTDAGVTGLGETCPIPHYLPAYARGVQPAIAELAPILLGSDPIGPEAVMSRADTWLQGHVYAKSAIDIALWDLTAKVAALPLYRVLGGRQAESMPLYHSITCIAPDDMARIAREAKAQGIGQFQAKLGASGDWQTDVERLTAVRKAVGPGPLVYGDWNMGATSLDATRVGRAARDLDIMLEQPCRTIADCARVRDATGLPMKLDEAAFDTNTLIEGHARACMDAVALKLSKFGGISACRTARDLCLHFGAKVCIEDTWGSDITTAALLHLAATTPPSRLLNTCDLSGYVGPRLDPNAPRREGGRIAPPEGPGLGVEPEPDILGDPDLTLE